MGHPELPRPGQLRRSAWTREGAVVNQFEDLRASQIKGNRYTREAGNPVIFPDLNNPQPATVTAKNWHRKLSFVSRHSQAQLTRMAETLREPSPESARHTYCRIRGFTTE